MNHSTVFAIKFLKQVTGPCKIIVACPLIEECFAHSGLPMSREVIDKRTAKQVPLPIQETCLGCELGRWCRCRVRLGAWALVLLQVAAAACFGAGAAAVCAWELGCWCRGRVPLLCAFGMCRLQRGVWIIVAGVCPNDWSSAWDLLCGAGFRCFCTACFQQKQRHMKSINASLMSMLAAWQVQRKLRSTWPFQWNACRVLSSKILGAVLCLAKRGFAEQLRIFALLKQVFSSATARQNLLQDAAFSCCARGRHQDPGLERRLLT